MARPDVVAGLDIGSGRVTALIGVTDPETRRLRVLGGSSVPCRGLKGGVVVSIAEAARSITQVLEEAEAAAKQLVGGVTLGLRGGHLTSFNNRGAYNIARTDKEITADDVSAVISNARAIPLSSDREILHVVPQGFSLDRQRGVPNPVGMEASLLEVEVHIVTASTAHLNNVMKAVAQAGFDVNEPVYGMLAAGELLVTPEEKDLGSVLIDLGGQTVSVGVYSEGSLRFSKELPIGSDFITRDLAIGLRTSMLSAESIKRDFGIAHSSLLNGDQEVRFQGLDGRTPQSAKVSTLMGIILPRVEEIFTVVAEELKASTFGDLAMSGGVILAGGGSLLRGTAEAAREVLDLPVRPGLAHPDQVIAEEPWLSPTYATALGLLTYSRGLRYDAWAGRSAARRRPKWLRRLSSILEELF